MEPMHRNLVVLHAVGADDSRWLGHGHAEVVVVVEALRVAQRHAQARARAGAEFPHPCTAHRNTGVGPHNAINA